MTDPFHYTVGKVLNNNAVISENEAGREVIIMGKGVGFNTRAGFRVDPKKHFKVYELKSSDRQKLETLLNEIPYDCFELSQQVIEHAEKALRRNLNPTLILALADHINFAVTSYLEGKYHPKLLNEEIRRFYREEYRCAEEILDMINHTYNIRMAESEAGSIAFHLINAESDESEDQTTRIISGTNDILQIIVDSLHIQASESSLSYSRLVTHIRYFLKRILVDEADGSGFMADQIRFNEDSEDYQKIAVALDQIADYLRKHYAYEINDEERLYLLIHLMRVLMSEKEEKRKRTWQ